MSFQRYLLVGAAAVVLVGSMVAGVQAQETSATIRGVIKGPSGEAVSGASVRVTHVPSGTVTNVTTNADGIFQASNLRVGGPYKVEVTASNYEGSKADNIFTSVGQVYEADASLKSAQVAETIVVTGRRDSQGIKTGPRTTVSADKIAALPTVNDDPKDVVRLSPYVTVDPTNGDNISVAGGRGRSNSLTVDNVRLNDDFGLNTQNSGYPTLRPPISEEAIESLAVNIAPYSVEYDKFTGGNINIVIKSGTNDFHGSAAYEYSDTNLRNDHVKPSTPPLGNGIHNALYVNQPFLDHTWYGTLGGPIWPDRAFFFTDYHRYTTTETYAFGPVDGAAVGKTNNINQAFINQVTQLAKSKLGFNFDTTHSITGSAPDENDKNALLKFDVNILPGQRFVGTYLRDIGTIPQDGLGSSTSRLDLASNYYALGERVEAYNYQLFSTWTDNFSTELTYSYKHDTHLASPYAGIQSSTKTSGDDPADPGQVTVQANAANCAGCAANLTATTASSLVFGPDISRQANNLWTAVNFYKGKANYTWGRHTFTGGYEREEYSAANIFLQNAEGAYAFNINGGVDGITNFTNGTVSSVTFADARADFNGDGVVNKLDSIALWGYAANSYYGQDTWDITDDLTVLAGVRYSEYTMSDKPFLNPSFLARYGYANTRNLDGLSVTLPRFSFNWKADSNTVIDGGFGLFTGGEPGVWVSNPFSNDGIRTASVTCQRANSAGQPITGTATCPITTNGATDPAKVAAVTQVLTWSNPTNRLYQVDPYLQTLVAGVAPNPSNTTNDIAPGFQIPSQWRASLEYQRSIYLDGLSDPWVVSAGVLYSKTKDESVFRDLRAGKPIGFAIDGRPIYNRAFDNTGVQSRATLTGVTSADSGQDVELFSTHKGHSLVWTVGLAKEFDSGIDFNVNYTNTSAVEAEPALSSVATSNYSGFATSDPNNAISATANTETKNRIAADVSWHHSFFGDNETRMGLFAEWRNGYPFSLTFTPVPINATAGTPVTSNTSNLTSGNCSYLVNSLPGPNNTITSSCGLAYFGDAGGATRQLAYIPSGTSDPKVTYVNTVVNGATVQTAAQTQQMLDNFINTYQSLAKYRGEIVPRNAMTNPDVFRVDFHFSQEFPAFFPNGAKLLTYVDIKNVLNLISNQWGLVKAVDFPSTAPVLDVSVDPTTGTYRYSNFRNPIYVFNTNSSFSSSHRSQWQILLGAQYKF